MKNTALITGASNGIGLELAKIHASKGGDLVLVARNKFKLDEIKLALIEEVNILYKQCVTEKASLIRNVARISTVCSN